jgi:hypothetical protein
MVKYSSWFYVGLFICNKTQNTNFIYHESKLQPILEQLNTADIIFNPRSKIDPPKYNLENNLFKKLNN